MPDYRSKRQKIEALLAADSGATEGERAAARAALGRLNKTTLSGKHGNVFVRGTRVASKTEWTLNFNRDPVDASSFGRSRTYETPVEGTYRPPSSLEELRSEIGKMSTEELIAWWMKMTEGMDDPDGDLDDGSASALCRRLGSHDWFTTGENVTGKWIRRCARCGTYDPPRRKR